MVLGVHRTTIGGMMRKILMCLILSLMFCCIAYAQRSSWNQGDLKMYGHSIDGDSTNGLNFDPDADATNEIVMNADGTITVLQVTYTGTDGNNGDVLTTDGAGTLSFSASIAGGAFTTTTDGAYLSCTLTMDGNISIDGNLTIGYCSLRDNAGGDLEYSEDGGGTWTDIGQGYTTISESGDVLHVANDLSAADDVTVGNVLHAPVILTTLDGDAGTNLDDYLAANLSPSGLYIDTADDGVKTVSRLQAGVSGIDLGANSDLSATNVWMDRFFCSELDMEGDLIVQGDTTLVDLTATGVSAIGINELSISGSVTLTAAHCRGTVVYCDGAATAILPTVSAGDSATFCTIGAVAISVDPNANDQIVLDGTVLDDGDKITNTSTSGDIAVLTYFPDNDGDGGSWYASTNSWTDGG